jgi:ribosomal protein S18 acetylase RimI-like enzyme
MPPRHFKLRPCRPEDLDFLWELKQRTMRPYVEQTWERWDEDEQAEYFRRSFTPENMKIIVVAGHEAGLVTVTRPPGEIYLSAIEILPEFQNRGIGAAIVRDLQAEAKAAGLPLRLQVLKVNHLARRLYQRLGFQPAGETDTHDLMVCPA